MNIKEEAFNIVVKKEVNIKFYQHCLNRRFGRRFYNNSRSESFRLTEEEWEILREAIYEF